MIKLVTIILFLFIFNSISICFENSNIVKINSQIDSLKILKDKLLKQISAIENEIQICENNKNVLLQIKFDSTKFYTKVKHSAPLLKKPSNLSPEITKIDNGTILELLDFNDMFFKVYYANKIGYIWQFYLEQDPSIEHFKTAKQKENDIKKIKLRETLSAQKKEEILKKYGKYWGEIIAENKVKIGMTTEMVIASWGKPTDINRSIGSWGKHEQWIYNGSYLYFEDGVLTAWQD